MFASKFVSLHICKETIQALYYKLNKFGVPVDGLAIFFFDKLVVARISSVIESTLTMNQDYVNYHVNLDLGVLDVSAIETASQGARIQITQYSRLKVQTMGHPILYKYNG